MFYEPIDTAMKTLLFQCDNPENLPSLYEELRSIGQIKEWYPCEDPQLSWQLGSVQFEKFEQAFDVLAKGVSIKNVRFLHQCYTNWSWVSAKNTNEIFFKQLDDKLNDDCIREIVKHIDILHLIHFANLNDRFKALTAASFLNLRIHPSTVGSMGLINFRYLLEKFGGSVKTLSVSLNAFSKILGFYRHSFKRDILKTIYKCTGPKLRAVYCYDFDWPDYEKENFDCILQMFAQRQVEIKFI